jgi:EAL domain-containing protein (putative c-di-GMP-specific phosphodiesterase class I)/GGDEF domain-containing protein
MDDASDNSLRALIVEDSDDDALLLVNALQDGGFKVDHVVVDSTAALQNQLRGGGWDVVFCDHSLPGLNAPNALEMVRNHDRDLPFIIVSGSMPDDLASQQMNKGAADFISKNNLSRLVPALRRELREAGTRRELAEVREALEYSRRYDSQTGLANAELLRREIQHKVQQGRPFLVALVELGQLRQTLKSADLEWNVEFWSRLGERIASLHENAVAARLGDDRFALLIGRGGDVDSDRTARSILRAMEPPIETAGHILYLPCHVGLSRFPESGGEVAGLLERAGIALQWAKDRTCDYALYRTGLETEREQRASMERALYKALNNREFVLHYQPQFDLMSGRMVGVEALLRWERPGHGLVSPAQFIPMLEETQLIVPVGEWVMRTAIETSRRWQLAGYAGLRMAVNLSAIQFRQGGLVEMVDRVLEQSGLAPELLELEITESIAMYNEQEIMGTLAALKERGVLLAIDDFGTGYSSLAYLKRFPIHRLKIDRAFVRDLTQDSGDAAIVKAILAMAASLNLGVIAEGVETLEQAEFLRGHGCGEAQGYLFGRPLPEEQLLQLLPVAGATGGRI